MHPPRSAAAQSPTRRVPDARARTAEDRIGPPTAVHRHLALAFGGASVRCEHEPRYRVFSVQHNHPGQYRLAVAHDLLRNVDDVGLVRFIRRRGLVACMVAHEGRTVTVDGEDGLGDEVRIEVMCKV